MDSLSARLPACNLALVFAIVLAIILLFADLCYYGVLSSPPCLAANCSSTRPSVKLMMQDHMGHYVHHYSADLFEAKTRISRLPFVTPNLITFLHLCVAIFAGYLVSNESLLVRRVGIFFFQFRFFLDMLDGAVYRAQNGKHTMVNGWGTWGYIIDATADIIGGIVLCIGLYFYLHRSPPRYRDGLPRSATEKARTTAEPFSMEMPVTRQMINFTLGAVLLQGLIRSHFWDRYQYQFYRILQVTLKRPADVAMQARIFNSPLTRFVLWCWKFSSADGMLAFLYLGVFLDCVWVILVILRRFGFVQVGVLVVVSQLLVWQMQELLPVVWKQAKGS